MIINFGGISEGVFAFFIVFCTLVGMATGAYLMDRERAIGYVRQTMSAFADIYRTVGVRLHGRTK
jgi:hypothetical protein